MLLRLEEYRSRRCLLLRCCRNQRESGTRFRLKIAQDALAAVRRMRVLP